MTLFGKGYFIWQIPKCDGGVPSAIAARAAEASLSHVVIKIADGTSRRYNVTSDNNTDLVPPVMSALRGVGVSVWGWHYVRGDDPVAEANLAIDRVRELGVDGYVIDAEAEYKKPGRREAAKTFMRELRTGLAEVPIALSTYRFPRIHTAFPFAEFLDRCDLAMPQVYFEEAHNPEEQLERCLEQYSALQPARPVVPTVPTYASSVWRPTPDEITRQLARAKELSLTAANAWSWDFASRPAFSDLWDAVAAFEWPPTRPEADIPDRLIELCNRHDAEALAGLYRDNAAHVTGAGTSVGRLAVAQWYNRLFTQLLPNASFELTGKSGDGNSRHFTWVAESERGKVLNGKDTLGLNEGQIQYHYTFFTVS